MGGDDFGGVGTDGRVGGGAVDGDELEIGPGAGGDFDDFVYLVQAQAEFFLGFPDGAIAVLLAGGEVPPDAFPVERIHILAGAALLEKKLAIGPKDEQVDRAMQQEVAVDNVAAFRPDLVVGGINDGKEFGGVGVVYGHG